MKLRVLVPEIKACSITGCSYNADSGCHARAITVGDGSHPRCDTYAPLPVRTKAHERAGVGACKVISCRHNRDMECEADAIRVGRHDGHADCTTFEALPLEALPLEA